MPDWRLKTDPVGGNIAIYSKKEPITASGSLSIGTGSRTFTVAAGLSVSVGDWFWAEPVPSAGRQAMVGQVTNYSGTALTLNVTRAIETGTFSSWRLTDHTPLYAPFTLPSRQRLQFHSGIPAPSTTPALTQTVAVTIPALNFNTVADRNYEAEFQLFAHGFASAPMVLGRVMNLNGAGNHVGINGDTPVFMNARGFGTFVAIGANATHVVLYVQALLQTNETPRAAQTISIEASAFNVLVGTGLPGNTPSAPLLRHVSGSHTTLGRERIDTRRRYIRQTGGAATMALSRDETLTVVGSGNTLSPTASYAQNELGWRVRYSCGGYVRQTTVGWDGSATNGGARNATTTPITR